MPCHAMQSIFIKMWNSWNEKWLPQSDICVSETRIRVQHRLCSPPTSPTRHRHRHPHVSIGWFWILNHFCLARIQAKWLIEIRIESIDAIDWENRLWGKGAYAWHRYTHDTVAALRCVVLCVSVRHIHTGFSFYCNFNVDLILVATVAVIFFFSLLISHPTNCGCLSFHRHKIANEWTSAAVAIEPFIYLFDRLGESCAYIVIASNVSSMRYRMIERRKCMCEVRTLDGGL